MLSAGEKVLVSVSGGPDSICLLNLLYNLQPRLGCELAVFHLNHKLRKAAAQEQIFVQKVCKRLGLPCFTKGFAIRKYAEKNNLNIEAAASQIRYQLLSSLAKKLSCQKIALGHTADDQAETVLMKLIRGSGITGLGGIFPVKQAEESGQSKIIRPLIEISHQEVLAYLKSQHLSYCLDISNLDQRYFRNRVRLQLLPQLEKYNPRIRKSLVQISFFCQKLEEYFQQETLKIFPALAKCLPGKIIIDFNKLLCYNYVTQTYIIKKALGLLKPKSEINFAHISSILNLTQSGKQIQLPDNLIVQRLYDKLVLNYEKKKSLKIPTAGLKIPGVTFIPELNLKITVTIRKSKIFNKSLIQRDKRKIFLDQDKIKSPLFIRLRKKGDRFSPFGGHGSRKLKDFFINEKIPRPERERIPLLIGNDKIIWVIGYRRAATAPVTENTKNILAIKAKSNETQTYESPRQSGRT